jgi:Protein of unknown function (DUF998)
VPTGTLSPRIRAYRGGMARAAAPAPPVAARANVVLPTVSGIAAAVFDCAFLLQGLSPSTLSAVNSLVSELEARDQPGSRLFGLASLLSGLMAMVFAVTLQRRLPPGRTGLAGCWAIALFGLGGIADALMPMDCAPSVEAACRRLEEQGRLSWFHQWHTWSSVLGTVALLASLWLLGRHLRGRPGWEVAAAVGRWGFPWLTAVSGVVAVMTLRYLPGLGVVQRVQTVGIAGWLVVLAVVQIRQPVHR